MLLLLLIAVGSAPPVQRAPYLSPQIQPAAIQIAPSIRSHPAAETLSANWKSPSLRRAIAVYSEERMRSQSKGQWRDAGAAALNAAELNFVLGEYRQSLTCAEQAASDFRRSKDSLGISRAVSQASQVSSLLGDNRRALDLSRRALSYYSRYRGTPPAVLMQPFSEALTNAGEVHYSIGDLVTASEYFQKVLRFSVAASDRRSEARARLFLGYIAASTGDASGAKNEYTRSLALSRAIYNPMAAALAMTAIATSHSSERENEVAITLHSQAMEIFQLIGDRQNEAVTQIGIGQAYQNLNENEIALSYYNAGLKVFEETGNFDYAVVALYQIAKVLQSQGQLREAEAALRRCVKVSQLAGKHRMLTYALKDLAMLQLARGERQADLADFLKFLRFYRKIGDRRGQSLVLNSIGDIHLASASTSESLVLYERALQLSREIQNRSIEISTRYNIARAEQALDRTQQAATSIRAALDLIEQLRSGIASSDFRSSYFTTQRQYYDRYIDLLMQLDQQQPGKGFAANALLVSEKARARSLAELVLRNHTQSQDLSVARLQEQLRDGNTLLLEYALGDERSYVWTVTDKSVKGYTLAPKALLERSANAVYEALTARQPTDRPFDGSYQTRVTEADKRYSDEANKLSRMLLEPIAHELGNKRLIIVSEGSLQYIPFEALPIPGNVNGDAPLISQNEVVTVPSVSVLAAIRSSHRRRSSWKNGIAVFADPVFGTSDQHDFLRLAHTLDEADEIASTAPTSTSIITGSAASRENVLQARLSQYRIVHFATHGLIDRQHPERSGIVLSLVKPDGSPNNGYLQLRDIYNLNMPADLVVLSACDTALGKEVRGEGVMGLTRAFMSAGSKSVIASLWKVDDRATAVLMKHFYRAMLHDGLPPAAALRSAKEIVRRQPGWGAPYYWAGFVLQGEYLDPIHLDDRSSTSQLLRLLLPALLLIAAFLLIKNRRTWQIDRQHA